MLARFQQRESVRRELVRDDFVTESRSLVDVKDRGEVETRRLVEPAG